jgi:hypothetical protein
VKAILTRAEGARGPANPEFALHIQACLDRCERELASGYREGVLSPMTDTDRLMVEIQLKLHQQELAKRETKDLFSN